MNPTEEQYATSYTQAEISHMRFAMRLSLGISFLMLFIKMVAYAITGSAAILSDAAESVVHVLAVGFAAYSFSYSLKPADARHMYGHDRISFFSAGFEGGMIVLAAIYIIYEAIQKWITGLVIEHIGIGILFTIVASIINGGLGWYLVRLGRKYHSIVLEANGNHVLTDGWTSLGVVVGLLLTVFTGWLPFDPILAILVALNILWTGSKLIRHSIGGLMDESDPKINDRLKELLETETQKYGIRFHHLRHRNAGSKLLIEFHLLFPDDVTIAEAHEHATMIEQRIYSSFPQLTEVMTHLEPMERHDEVHQKILNRLQGGE